MALIKVKKSKSAVATEISKTVFRARLTMTEQLEYTRLLVAGNVPITLIDGTLRDTSYVNLKDESTIFSANALFSEGVLKNAARVDELLANEIL
jgi:hypothetical protein